ncbi:thioredoxin/glutathione peroxidase btue [Anaeramoeba ignava]|uniref:Glutathione peroxidase n=1 Tax=Anaeramoeba ignava TaxID=1746090 RepID=A0A9Q0R7I5_ANAIG|nr:thioredoxin/glutathione peroxidase btue [Anaeramoeba ignava]
MEKKEIEVQEDFTKKNSVLDFKMKDIKGEEVDLSIYKGKVVMIVNVASKCGFTKQYEGLESIYEKYKDQGFVILGFPANNFLWQEPKGNSEILKFCSTKYHVTFPMFSKISVKKEPLYKFLTSKETDPNFSGKITWNFNKFIIGRNGKIVARFGSRKTPESDEIIKTIEKELKEELKEEKEF